jgi:protein O-GlcNAc transferase
MFQGASNYYHLHTDVLLPLYRLWQEEFSTHFGAEKLVLVPTVNYLTWPEPKTHGGIEWTTDAFQHTDKYWTQALHAFSDLPLFPLTHDSAQALASRGGKETYCLEGAILGLPNVADEPALDLVEGFVAHTMRTISGRRSEGQPLESAGDPVVGLVSRTGRRMILNEGELQGAASAAGIALHPVDFSSMTYLEQLAAVQRFTVLVGMQGAGMINAMYLREGAVAVVLFQYGATEDMFRRLLSSRGPYLHWVNGHENNSICNTTIDRFCDSPNTIVDPTEFVALLRSALAESQVPRGEQGEKRELR